MGAETPTLPQQGCGRGEPPRHRQTSQCSPRSLQGGDLQGNHNPRLHGPDQRHWKSKRERGEGRGSPGQAGGPRQGPGFHTHSCSTRSRPSPSYSRQRSSSPPGTAGPCRLRGGDRDGTQNPPAPRVGTQGLTWARGTHPRGDEQRTAPRSARRTRQPPPGSPAGT